MKILKKIKENYNQHFSSKLTIVIAGAITAVVTVVGGVVFVLANGKILDATDGEVKAISSIMSKKISTYYNGLETSVKLVGSNPEVLSTVKALDAHKTRILGDATRLDSEEYKRVQQQLDSMVQADDAILGAYIGTAKDQFLKAPASSYPSDYRASQRGWYKQAEAAGEFVWSEPYADAQEGVTCITAAIPVKENGKVVAVLGIDINFEALADDLKENFIGKSGVNAIIAKEGEDYKVIYATKPEFLSTTVNKAIVDEATNSEEQVEIKGLKTILDNAPTDANAPSRYEKVNFNGQELRAAVTKDDNIGLYKLITVENDEYNSGSLSLLASTVAVGITTGLAVLVLISRGLKVLGEHIDSVNSSMTKLKEGDLTVKLEGEILEVENEIGQLATSLNTSVSTLRTLMSNIDEASKSLGNAAEEVSVSATETNARIEEIATTMNDIVEGISEQAATAEDSNTAVVKLAERLEYLKEASVSISGLTQEVKNENEQGLHSVNDLKYYTEENNKSSQAVASNINELSKKAETIETIVDTMSTIADQTNILALNASIEAARAGEMGAGFSVVAGEVKKLAEQSARHAESIREIITAIQKDIEKSVKDVDSAISIAEKQSNAVETVVDAFSTISNSTESITESISNINEFVNTLNDDKDAIVENIEKIARVSQRSAASSEQISASVQEQSALSQNLASMASKLNELSSGLSEDVKKFEI